MKAKHIILKISLILFCLSSCNVTYKVLSTENELEHLVHMPCGKLSVEMIGKGNSKFTLSQRFDITEKISLNPGMFRTYFNGNQVDIKYLNKNIDKETEELEIIGKEKIEFYFELSEGVFEGDTIAVYAPRYMNCMGDFVGIDTVYYTFVNRLRIYGVNAL